MRRPPISRSSGAPRIAFSVRSGGKAIADTEQIYGRSAKQYVRRVKRAWKAWQRHQDRVRPAPPRRQAA
jgi:hypothetical protein